jgi:hypothetical protein
LAAFGGGIEVVDMRLHGIHFRLRLAQAELR